MYKKKKILERNYSFDGLVVHPVLKGKVLGNLNLYTGFR